MCSCWRQTTNVTAFYFFSVMSKLKPYVVMKGNWWNILTLRDKFGKIPSFEGFIQKHHWSVFCFCTVNHKVFLQTTSWASHHSVAQLVLADKRHAIIKTTCTVHAASCHRVSLCFLQHIYTRVTTELIAVLHHIGNSIFSYIFQLKRWI